MHAVLQAASIFPNTRINVLYVELSSEPCEYSCRSSVAQRCLGMSDRTEKPPSIDYQPNYRLRKWQLVCFWVAEEYICTSPRVCKLSGVNSAEQNRRHLFSIWSSLYSLFLT